MGTQTSEMNSDSEDKEKSTVNLDRILVNEIGEIGPYQLRTLCLSAVLVIFATWATSEFNFTTARINTRCLIPECETKETAEFSPSWILNAVPASGESFDNCQRFESLNVTLENDVCPAEWFNQDLTEDCQEFVYENTETVVYDYGLACDEWRRTIMGSVRTVGLLTGLPITGYVSDRWGRRTALSLTAFNTAWIGSLRYFAGTYIGFIISQVAEAMFGAGAFSCCYVLLMELVGPNYRVAAGAIMNTAFAVGQIFLAFIAWGVPDWRNLTLTLYIPQLISITYFWIMPESIRWYISKGRFEEAEKVLKDVARVNKKELSTKSLEELRNEVIEIQRKMDLKKSDNAEEPWLIVLIFRYKPMLVRILVSPVWWITNTFIYYGMSINSVNMSGNRYMNYAAVSAVEIPGFWTAVFLMERIGRKPVLAGAFWVCAACQFGYIFLPDDQRVASLTVYLIGKYTISMVVTSLYMYTVELYPTKYRHKLFAFSLMMGRIGTLVAPLTPALAVTVWDNLPFALFGGFALLSGLLVLVTPETLGSKLPDTMEEASNIGVKKKKTVV